MNQRPTPDQIPILWRRFHQDCCQKARAALIEHYAYLVKVTAWRLTKPLPASMDKDDLVSAGNIGLIKAVDLFDPTRQVKFETFAIALIRGAILEFLREDDWVPRSIRELQKQIEQAYRSFEQAEGREPNQRELAEVLEMPEERLQEKLLDIERSQTFSLEDVLHGESGRDIHVVDVLECKEPSPWAQAHQHGQEELLAKTVARLPEREREVIERYYGADQTFKEIGKAMKISESRVYQLHGQAITRLRAGLQGIWE